jgi:hypothetical protein
MHSENTEKYRLDLNISFVVAMAARALSAMDVFAGPASLEYSKNVLEDIGGAMGTIRKLA